MVKRKTSKVDAPNRRCLDCSKAYLMRSSEYNPIVSECTLSKERHVATTPHAEDCGFKKSEKPLEIHEMINLKQL